MAEKLARNSYLTRNEGNYPEKITVGTRVYVKNSDLRYGTNPHQPAALYVPEGGHGAIADMKTLKSGKNGLSQTNLEDISGALNIVKFFPAGVYGGLKAMKALSAPFGGIKFIPTGGIDAKNLKEYLEASFVHAVGGSWLCPKKEIAAGNFDAVTALCREASQIVKEVRG